MLAAIATGTHVTIGNYVLKYIFRLVEVQK